MRDRVNRPSEGFDPFPSPRLSPAEGLESAASLFTSPPIESLELLRELGEIAAASFAGTEALLPPEPATIAGPAEISPGSLPSPPDRSPLPKPEVERLPSADERLLEALLEYHRLRGPELGARTAPRPSADADFSRADASTEPGERFSPVEIPVVQDVVPKTAPGGIRASRPVQTILKPKPRA